MQKTNKKGFLVEKVITREGDKICVKWKGNNISLDSWIDKNDIVLINQYFLEPNSWEGKVKKELHFPNYSTKSDFKNATGADASKFAKKVDLASLKSNVHKLDTNKWKNLPSNLSNLKSKVDKLDAHKLMPVPVHLSKLNNVVKMVLLIKMYIILRSKILKIKYLILLT